MIKLFKNYDDPYFDVFTVESGHNKITYREIPLRKCPFDYVIYQMILFEVKPDLIIEIGTDKGGSALYLADLLNLLGNGIIHTIDIKDEITEVVKKHDRIKSFYNGWQKYSVENARGYERVLIIEDSTHYYKDTLEILYKFSSLINTGSYFIVEDGIINKLGWVKQFDGGPLRAINEFLTNSDQFVIDKKWINMFGRNATFNVNGYLKKIEKND